MTSAEAASLLGDLASGSLVAIGGTGLQRKPMTLVRALARSGATDLRIVSYLGSVDVEYLIATGVVAEVHSAGVGLDGFGLAPAFRSGRQNRSLRFVEWSEGSLATSLQAAALGLPSMPTPTSPDSAVVDQNPFLGSFPDPFDGTSTVSAQALQIDLCLLHLSGVDERGNGYITGDYGADQLLARAATRTVATADELVVADPRLAAIPRLWLAATQVVTAGSWPTGSHPSALVDVTAVGRWAGKPGDDAALLEPRT
ncbi:MAG: acyl CoA--acetate/3-ketoacid CoA transferase subunit alpha [bacterium]|nr:acyl CoA--acetate/3-ketoacid CoA transferase subunit alpha [bacterium]